MVNFLRFVLISWVLILALLKQLWDIRYQVMNVLIFELFKIAIYKSHKYKYKNVDLVMLPNYCLEFNIFQKALLFFFLDTVGSG